MYGFDSLPSSLINDTPDPSSAKTTRLGAAPCNLDQSVGADGKATQAMVINASANATEPTRVLKMLRSHKAAKIDARPITIFRVTDVPNAFSKVKPIKIVAGKIKTKGTTTRNHTKRPISADVSSGSA